MAESIILGIIIGKIKGYKIKELLYLKQFYLIIFAELLVVFLQINIYFENYTVLRYAGILKTFYLCSFIPLIFKVGCYKESIIGSGLVLLGGVLNDIAIKFNGGYMPVYPTLSRITGYCKIDAFEKVNDIHILGDASTRLKCLTDIFDIGYAVLSIGDIFIRSFVVIIIYYSIKYSNKKLNKY